MQPVISSGTSQLQPSWMPVTSELLSACSAMHGRIEPVNQNTMHAAKPKTIIIGHSCGG